MAASEVPCTPEAPRTQASSSTAVGEHTEMLLNLGGPHSGAPLDDGAPQSRGHSSSPGFSKHGLPVGRPQ